MIEVLTSLIKTNVHDWPGWVTVIRLCQQTSYVILVAYALRYDIKLSVKSQM